MSRTGTAVTTYLANAGLAVAETRCYTPVPSDADNAPRRCDVTLAPPLTAAEAADAIDTLASLPTSDLRVPRAGEEDAAVAVGRVFLEPSDGCHTGRACEQAPRINIQSLAMDGAYVGIAQEILRDAAPASLTLTGNEQNARVKVSVRGSVSARIDARPALQRLLSGVARFASVGATTVDQEVTVCVTSDAGCAVSVSAETQQPWSDESLATIDAVAGHLDDERIDRVFVRMSAKTATLSVQYALRDGTPCWDVPAEVLATLPPGGTAEGFTTSPGDPDTPPSCTP